MISATDKAEEMVRVFDFNGYVLNQSNLEISKEMAIRACSYVIEEIENQYQVNYWYQVIEEIKKIEL
jgi:hypothetical protein